MSPVPKRFVAVVLGVLLAWACAVPARAQDDTRDEFWPEVDGFVRLGPQFRLMFLASETRNREIDLREGTVGVNVDFFAKPFAREWLHEHPDVTKQRFLTFRAGYHYSWDIREGAHGYQENRLLVEGTGRFPMGRLFFLNRNRFEYRDVDGESSWRYRNRSRLEGDISMGTRTATPYASAEFFYDDRYDEWNRQLYYAGVDWPVFKKAVLDTYYARQNDSRSSIEHVNAFGATLSLYF